VVFSSTTVVQDVVNTPLRSVID